MLDIVVMIVFLKCFLFENILKYFIIIFLKKLFLTPTHQNNLKTYKKLILNKKIFKTLTNA
jgi:hypothetical protein